MDEINTRIAERLRWLRRASGLTLEDLSARSGVSRGTLSQIETLKTNPTIAVLWRVAQGLGVPFSELLGSEEAPPAVRVFREEDARYLFSEDGALRSRPLVGNLPGHRVELYGLKLRAGAVHASDAHAGADLEHLTVQEGRLLLTVDEESCTLEKGDAVLFAADRPHRYEALGEADFEGLSLILYAG